MNYVAMATKLFYALLLPVALLAVLKLFVVYCRLGLIRISPVCVRLVDSPWLVEPVAWRLQRRYPI